MMGNFHGRIMNMPIDPANVLDGWTEGELRAYKYGHRDARHNAAVMGNDADIALHAADARVAELEAECARLRGALETAADSLGQLERTLHINNMGYMTYGAEKDALAALATTYAGAATGATGTGGAG